MRSNDRHVLLRSKFQQQHIRDVMYTINDDDDDDGKVDPHEQYEKSVLVPLRRRLSDGGDGSTTSPLDGSSPRKLPPTTILFKEKRSENSKENERIAVPADCRTRVMNNAEVSSFTTSHGLPSSGTKATPEQANQHQPAKMLKSWYVPSYVLPSLFCRFELST